MDYYLPEFEGMKNLLRSGRNIYEESQRGWGLRYGNLDVEILSDPLYQKAWDIVKEITIMDEMRRMNVFLLLKYFISKLPPGDIIEYGTYMGGDAIFMALLAKQIDPNITIIALDTFEGMPATDSTLDMHSQGDFSEANYEKINEYKKT